MACSCTATGRTSSHTNAENVWQYLSGIHSLDRLSKFLALTRRTSPEPIPAASFAGPTRRPPVEVDQLLSAGAEHVAHGLVVVDRSGERVQLARACAVLYGLKAGHRRGRSARDPTARAEASPAVRPQRTSVRETTSALRDAPFTS
jgi:hypothetical protein